MTTAPEWIQCPTKGAFRVHTLRSLAAMVALSFVAAACGGGGDERSAPPGPQETLDPNAQLRVGLERDQITTEGPRATLGLQPGIRVTETLTYLTENWEVKPRLAERWEFRPPNTWRFFIRRGVMFHDGQPLNAQAVKEGLFDRTAEIAAGGTIKAGPGSAAIVDEYTVDFTPTVPNVRVPEQLVHTQHGVRAPGTDHGKRPVGTGPFRFVEYMPKERLVVERNPDYWGEKAKVARITFRFYEDPSARVLALQAGDIDLMTALPRGDAKSVKDKGVQVINSPVGAYEAMYVNVHGTDPYDLLKDVNVRKAVAQAIDRRKLVDGVLDGLASPEQSFVPAMLLGRHAGAVQGFQYDPARARSLLDAAGWRPGGDGIRTKGGRRLELTIVSGFPSAAVHKPIPEFVQSELKAIGIETKIVERPDSASFYDLMKAGEGDLWFEQGNQNDANPAFLANLLFSTDSSTSTPTGDTQRISAPGTRFNELLAPSLKEVDLDRAQAATAAALHELIDVQATVIPLAGIFRIYGAKSTVRGVMPHPSYFSFDWAAVGVVAR